MIAAINKKIQDKKDKKTVVAAIDKKKPKKAVAEQTKKVAVHHDLNSVLCAPAIIAGIVLNGVRHAALGRPSTAAKRQ